MALVKLSTSSQVWFDPPNVGKGAFFDSLCGRMLCRVMLTGHTLVHHTSILQPFPIDLKMADNVTIYAAGKTIELLSF